MATTTGSLTAVGQAVTLSGFNPDPEIIVQVSGTYAGISLAFSGSPDGGTSNFTFPAQSIDQIPKGAKTPEANSTRFWRFTGTDLISSFAVTCTAFTSGSMTVTITSYGVIGSSAPSGGGSGTVVTPSPNSQAITITTSGAGYVAGDVVGGIISLPAVNSASGRRVKLKSFVFKDKNGNAAPFHIYFFKVTPAGGTYTDNGPLAWGANDLANCVGDINVLASDWVTDNGQCVATYSNLDHDMSVTGTTLFMLIIAEGTATLTNGNLTAESQFDQE